MRSSLRLLAVAGLAACSLFGQKKEYMEFYNKLIEE